MNLMFYGCKSPSSAIDVVRKYSTPVSAKMLTYLNEKFGEEGIEEEPFKVVEGKLILNPKKYATLKHLDGVNPFKGFIAREHTAAIQVTEVQVGTNPFHRNDTLNLLLRTAGY